MVEFIFKLRPELKLKGYRHIKDLIRLPSDKKRLSPIDNINIPAVIWLIEDVDNIQALLLKEIQQLVQQSETKGFGSSQAYF